MNNLKRGFTLIELLVVIAVLGVLATVVIVAINPFQQLAKTRDAGRVSTVAQLGQAEISWSTSNNGAFPTAATWTSTLTAAGEISIVPAAVAYSTGPTNCLTNVINNTWCHKTTGANGPMIVYARLEATTNNSRCGALNAWAVYSSYDGRGGIVCSAAEPNAPPVAGPGMTFLP